MSASLVGSEMCIRDRMYHKLGRVLASPAFRAYIPDTQFGGIPGKGADMACLLYTSDAADDM
eukprot:8645474-Alexandrium_andersonii.AAC.1